MKIKSTTQSREKIFGLAAVAIAVGALTACSGGSPASADIATTPPASANAAADNHTDPVARNKSLGDSAVVNDSTTTRKPCDLMTREDSEAAVGQPLLDKTDNNLGMCHREAEDSSAGTSISVGDWEGVKELVTDGSTPPEAISGVGDEAFNIVIGKTAPELFVRKGDDGFLVEVHGPKIDALPDHGLAKEKELALKILGKF
jgi:hypothetical protein